MISRAVMAKAGLTFSFQRQGLNDDHGICRGVPQRSTERRRGASTVAPCRKTPVPINPLKACRSAQPNKRTCDGY